MLSYKESLKILKKTNALLEGHFYSFVRIAQQSVCAVRQAIKSSKTSKNYVRFISSKN